MDHSATATEGHVINWIDLTIDELPDDGACMDQIKDPGVVFIQEVVCKTQPEKTGLSGGIEVAVSPELNPGLNTASNEPVSKLASDTNTSTVDFHLSIDETDALDAECEKSNNDDHLIKSGLIDESEFGLLYIDVEKYRENMSYLYNPDSTPKSAGQLKPKSNSKVQPSSKTCTNDSKPKKRGRPKKNSKKHSHKPSKQNKNMLSPEAALPDRLKKRPKTETTSIIDLTNREVKPIFESTFVLEGVVTSPAYLALKNRQNCCLFCNQTSNIRSLDVLFGPYKLKVEKEATSRKTGSQNANQDTFLDVWVHRDCVIWTPDICLRGCQLHGLAAAINASWKSVRRHFDLYFPGY